MVPPVDSQAFVTLLYCLNFPEKSKLFSLRFGEKSVSEGLQSKQIWPETHRFALPDLAELTVTKQQGTFGAALGFYLCV